MSERPVILVVDDDPPILLLMRNLLREFGFETLAASTGEQAIAQANETTPDLVLLDRNMPGMSGEETLRELRTLSGFDGVPVLILSGEPMEPKEIHDLGATDAVLKPFDVPALIAKIRSHVSRN